MTENPDQPAENSSSESAGSERAGSERPPLADQIRAKMDEYDVDRHLNDLATTVESAVRTGLAKAGEFAHEHKGDLERLFDKAAGAVDRRTDGRHADTIQQVRGSLERGVDKLAEQRGDDGPGEATGDAAGSTDVPPSNG